MREADDVPTEPLGGVERPLRVVRLARLMQRRVRAFGPAFGRRRYGGNLSLTCLLLTVACPTMLVVCASRIRVM
jgi:hypothetical protein